MNSFGVLRGAAVASVFAVAALAHSSADGVVKERMEAMEAMRDAVKRVVPMMSGAAAYDPQAVRAAARVIEAHSGGALTALFPDGAIAPPSEARPRIWTDWARFSALAEELGVAARGLELAAGNGLGGGSAGGMMGAGMMGGGMMGGQTAPGMGMRAEDIGLMPADAAFAMTTQVCSACHDRFRAEDD
ncbi:cytochrome c [Actibacterium sp. MT2.3-13A]|uniref:c-type cytochrome n=1 Tax=Actibacterium sp. MT2.3-13A TaxID=2828332 RepID=UPI001BAAFE89|nr:cytochrome c [Actibacterium sp. MT2.3-13A]